MKTTKILLKGNKKRFLSIDFGHVFIKIVYIESKGLKFTILDYAFKKISSIQDSAADIVNFICSFIKNNSIAEKETYLTLSEQDFVVIKYFVLPKLPKTEILEAIKWKLKQEHSFNLEDFILEWRVVKEYSDDDATVKNRILCALAKREAIDKYLAIVGQCNLTPEGISSSCFNYENILRRLKTDSSTTALLNIESSSADLYIYNGDLNFVRSLVFSSEAITQSLIKALAQDTSKNDFSPEKVEEIKNIFGIPRDETVVLPDNIQAAHILSFIRSFLDGLVKELKRSFDYFTYSFKGEKPSICYISGEGANLKNLDWYLNKELNINTLNLPLPDCVDVEVLDKQKLGMEQNLIISAVGAGLGDSASINLLPAEIKAQKVEIVEKAFLRLLAIIFGAIFLFSLFIVKFQIYDYRKRLDNAQAHLKIIEVVKVLKQRIELREKLIKKIKKTQLKSVTPDKFLDIIAANAPNSIVLNGLSLNQKDHQVVLNGTISASVDSAESVLARFIKKLQASSAFNEVSLIFSRKSGAGEEQEFQIKCDLVY